MDFAKSCFFLPWRSFILEHYARDGTDPPHPSLLLHYSYISTEKITLLAFPHISLQFPFYAHRHWHYVLSGRLVVQSCFIVSTYTLPCIRDSSVSLVTKLRARGPGVGTRVPNRLWHSAVATDLGHPYWIYIIPIHGMHQWLLLQFLVLLMMDAESVRNM